MTVHEIRYCLIGCTTMSDGRKVRAQLDPGTRSLVCDRCERSIKRWLRDIPDNYALLPWFIEHGTVERNPDSQSTKAAYAPAPARLEVMDLLDGRHGLKWNGTAPAHDRRGVIGTLQVYAERVQAERGLTGDLGDLAVSTACAMLERHRLWITEQDWVTLFFDELKILNRQLSDAVGDYRRPPVGTCHAVTEDKDECGGSLFASVDGGVNCARCGAAWDVDHLRQLGLAQNAASSA
jgi:hypothetical protein